MAEKPRKKVKKVPLEDVKRHLYNFLFDICEDLEIGHNISGCDIFNYIDHWIKENLEEK